MKDRVQNIPIHCPPLVRRTASIADSLRLLSWLDADLAVICDFGPDDLVGWISQQTLRNAADQFDIASESIRVDRIMAPGVDACYAHHPIAAARSLANHRQARFLAVFDIHETFHGIVFAGELHRRAADRTPRCRALTRSEMMPDMQQAGTR